MPEPYFLTLAEVVAIHSDQIARYGGPAGIRDMALLEYAIAQPSAGFGGHYFHRNLHEMAAACAFHLCQNHPFFDGNKRVAIASALVFLCMNDIKISDPRSTLIEVMFNVAQSKLSKPELAATLKGLSRTMKFERFERKESKV